MVRNQFETPSFSWSETRKRIRIGHGSLITNDERMANRNYAGCEVIVQFASSYSAMPVRRGCASVADETGEDRPLGRGVSHLER